MPTATLSPALVAKNNFLRKIKRAQADNIHVYPPTAVRQQHLPSAQIRESRHRSDSRARRMKWIRKPQPVSRTNSCSKQKSCMKQRTRTPSARRLCRKDRGCLTSPTRTNPVCWIFPRATAGAAVQRRFNHLRLIPRILPEPECPK